MPLPKRLAYLELMGGLVGWLWMATTLVVIASPFMAIWGGWSWWYVLLWLIVSGSIQANARSWLESKKAAAEPPGASEAA